MNIANWESFTLHADEALNKGDDMMAIVLYQKAFAEVEDQEIDGINADDAQDLLTAKVASCHNLAKFWRSHSEPEYELKYLQLASEQVMALVPQCPNQSCSDFVESLGCCEGALFDFLKRHPNPKIAAQMKQHRQTNGCELIARFRLS